LRGIAATVVDPILPRSTADLQTMRDIPAPRAKLTNIRSMEHARRWGIAERLRDVAPLGRDFPRTVLFVTSLRGYTLARIDAAFGYDGGDADLFAEGPLQCPQFLVESVLRERAAELPTIRLQYGTQLETFSDGDGGVTASVVDGGGNRRTIRARYLAGCDGAKSTVRRQLGIAMEGESALSGSLNIIFRAPGLQQCIAKERAIHYWTINETAPGIFGPLDGADVWWAVLGKVAADVESARALDPMTLLRAGAGYDLDAEVLDVSAWAPHRLLAQSFGAGNVFLAGDAAHLHAPFGGHGMNLGIGDAVDLGWKLAAVLHGWGGSRLLASYEAERRPLARRVIDEATRNFAAVSNAYLRPELDEPTPEGAALRAAIEPEIVRGKLPEFHSAGLVCGYTYDGSPIVVPDATPRPPESVVDFTPNARPGSRAPHRRLSDGSSLYDRFGSWFTLLTDSAHAEQADRVVRHAHARGIPVGASIVDDARLPELYGATYCLIRPDQHVAWRANELPGDLDGMLDTVRGARSLVARR
jgi:2-polyprenyl-6-methoxyphenol hydroxylase-like FAD-dependent oxidoreductase